MIYNGSKCITNKSNMNSDILQMQINVYSANTEKGKGTFISYTVTAIVYHLNANLGAIIFLVLSTGP